MKTAAAILAVLCILAAAGDFVLTWDAVPQAAYYTLYEKTGDAWQEVGQQTTPGAGMVDVPDGLHTYAVSVTDIHGAESALSIPLTVPVPVPLKPPPGPLPPDDLRIARVSVQMSQDLETWETVAEFDPPAGWLRCFARMKFAGLTKVAD